MAHDSFRAYLLDEYKHKTWPEVIKDEVERVFEKLDLPTELSINSTYDEVRSSDAGVIKPLGFMYHWTAGRDWDDISQSLINRELVQLYLRKNALNVYQFKILSDGRTGHPGRMNGIAWSNLVNGKGSPYIRAPYGNNYTYSDAYAGLIGMEIQHSGTERTTFDAGLLERAWAIGAVVCRVHGMDPALQAVDHAGMTSRKVDVNLEEKSPGQYRVKYHPTSTLKRSVGTTVVNHGAKTVEVYDSIYNAGDDGADDKVEPLGLPLMPGPPWVKYKEVATIQGILNSNTWPFMILGSKFIEEDGYYGSKTAELVGMYANLRGYSRISDDLTDEVYRSILATSMEAAPSVSTLGSHKGILIPAHTSGARMSPVVLRLQINCNKRHDSALKEDGLLGPISISSLVAHGLIARVLQDMYHVNVDQLKEDEE